MAKTQDIRPPDVARDPNAAARALVAMDLALKGKNYTEIARLAGYASRGAAFNAVQRELQRTLQHKADELRTLEAQRLNAMFDVMYTKAIAGDTWSVDRALAIMERRAKLFGLDTQAGQLQAAGQVLVRTYDAEAEAV